MSFYEIIFVAIALGMDSFSLSVGVGIGEVKKYDLLKFGLVVGFLHLILPLIGLYLGKRLGMYLGQLATYLGGIILILLGVKILREAFYEGEVETTIVGIGIVLLPLTVSLDALTVGFSLGTLVVQALPVALFFGAVAFMMTMIGATLGDRLGYVFEKADFFGGIILIILGVKMIVM